MTQPHGWWCRCRIHRSDIADLNCPHVLEILLKETLTLAVEIEEITCHGDVWGDLCGRFILNRDLEADDRLIVSRSERIYGCFQK